MIRFTEIVDVKLNKMAEKLHTEILTDTPEKATLTKEIDDR